MHLSIPDRCHGIVDKFNTENQLIKVISVEKESIVEFGKIPLIEIGSLQTFSIILANKRTSTGTSSKTQLIIVVYHHHR